MCTFLPIILSFKAILTAHGAHVIQSVGPLMHPFKNYPLVFDLKGGDFHGCQINHE